MCAREAAAAWSAARQGSLHELPASKPCNLARPTPPEGARTRPRAARHAPVTRPRRAAVRASLLRLRAGCSGCRAENGSRPPRPPSCAPLTLKLGRRAGLEVVSDGPAQKRACAEAKACKGWATVPPRRIAGLCEASPPLPSHRTPAADAPTPTLGGATLTALTRALACALQAGDAKPYPSLERPGSGASL